MPGVGDLLEQEQHNQGGLDPDPSGDSPNKRQKTADDATITARDSIAQAGDVDPLRAWVDSLNFFNPDLIYTKLRSAGKTLSDIPSMSNADFTTAGIPMGVMKTIDMKRKEAGSLAPAMQSPSPALRVHPSVHTSVDPRVPTVAVAAAPVPIPSGMRQPLTQASWNQATVPPAHQSRPQIPLQAAPQLAAQLALQQKVTQQHEQQLAHQQQQRQQIAQAAVPGMAAQQQQQRVAQSSTHVGASSRLSSPLPCNFALAQPRVGGAVAVAAQQSTARPAANTATGTGKFRFGPLTWHCDSRVGVDQYSMRPHAAGHSCAAAQRSVGSAVLQAGQPLRSASVLAQRRRRVLCLNRPSHLNGDQVSCTTGCSPLECGIPLPRAMHWRSER